MDEAQIFKWLTLGYLFSSRQKLSQYQVIGRRRVVIPFVRI